MLIIIAINGITVIVVITHCLLEGAFCGLLKHSSAFPAVFRTASCLSTWEQRGNVKPLLFPALLLVQLVLCFSLLRWIREQKRMVYYLGWSWLLWENNPQTSMVSRHSSSFLTHQSLSWVLPMGRQLSSKHWSRDSSAFHFEANKFTSPWGLTTFQPVQYRKDHPWVALKLHTQTLLIFHWPNLTIRKIGKFCLVSYGDRIGI